MVKKWLAAGLAVGLAFSGFPSNAGAAEEISFLYEESPYETPFHAISEAQYEMEQQMLESWVNYQEIVAESVEAQIAAEEMASEEPGSPEGEEPVPPSEEEQPVNAEEEIPNPDDFIAEIPDLGKTDDGKIWVGVVDTFTQTAADLAAGRPAHGWNVINHIKKGAQGDAIIYYDYDRDAPRHLSGAERLWEGIKAVIKAGARIINMSWILTGTTYEAFLAPRLTAVWKKFQGAVLMVAGAGNNASDQIPAPARLPEVLAVSVKVGNKIASYANFNIKNVSLAVDQKDLDDIGTSLAAGFMSGWLARTLSFSPTAGIMSLLSLAQSAGYGPPTGGRAEE